MVVNGRSEIVFWSILLVPLAIVMGLFFNDILNPVLGLILVGCNVLLVYLMSPFVLRLSQASQSDAEDAV